MKILYIVNEFPKLSETFILNEIIELTKLGHKIKILANTQKENKIHDDVLKYNLLKNTIYSSSKYKRGTEKATGFIKNLTLDLLKSPASTIKVLSSLYKTQNNIWTALDSYLGIRQLKNQKIDIINVTFSSPENIDKAFFISLILNKPFILTFRANDIYKKPNTKELKKRIKIINKAAKIITISKYNRKYLKNQIGIKKSIEIVHSSINTNIFKSTKKGKKNKIITIGRAVEKKGISYLIKACKILKEKKRNFQCTIIGEGPLQEEYKKLIKRFKLENEVKLKGSLTQAQVKKELEESTIFALPCIIEKNNDRDILANVIKEAMAMEIPVITSKISQG